MIFKTGELDFLNLYAVCINNTDEMSEKFEIFADPESKTVTFTQFSSYIKFITVLENKDITEEFKLILSTDKFVKLLKMSSDDDVDINKLGIDFPSGHYDFGTEEWSNQDDLKAIQEKLNQNPSNKNIEITDLQFLLILKSYMGKEGLDAVHLNKGYFVASNKFDSTGVIKTKNDSKISMFLTKEVADICKILKLENLTFDFYDDNDPAFYTFDVGNTKVIIVHNQDDYIIPDVFDPDTEELYKHKDIITVNKEELKLSLDKIKTFASENLDSRIFITVKSDHILIESKDNGYAFEKVTAKVDNVEIYGIEILVSAMYLSMMVRGLLGEKINISIPVEEEPVAIEVNDEEGSRFFIHCLYDAID